MLKCAAMLLAATALGATPALAEPDYAAAVRADYARSLAPLFDHFHRNPELSFKETATAARMAKELRAIPGLVVTEKVGGTGIVGVMKNGEGPVVLVRADMDGLPVEEKSGLGNASKARQVDVDGVEKPVMHACGHDTHITGLVATARQLAATKDRWKGTLVFIVQPAEERVGGAKAMLEDGLYTRFPKPDYALAWHVSSNLASGKVSASETIQYASADSVNIIVHGIGAHGASPHAGRDPIYIGAQIVTALQGLVGREIDPVKPALITVGSFHSGSKHNIISDRAELLLTVRANDEETRQYLLKAIPRVARDIARANGMPENRLPEVTHPEGTPVTLNDAALTRRLNATLAKALGSANVMPYVQQGMGGEDFAYFVEPKYGVKGYYFAVGGTPQAAFDAAKAGGPPVPSHHSPLFKIDPEPAIVTGTIAMTAAVLELLGPGAASGNGR
ncbi:MAG: amidohydrolase [Sphingomicrobium sp.]